MKTATEIFGAEWRGVDVTWLSEPDKRVELMGKMAHAETLTFGMACNALIRSLLRVDDLPRQHYAGGRQRFTTLRSGMFTLADMARAAEEYHAGKRWISGYGPACDAVMGQFFDDMDVEETVDESAERETVPTRQLRDLLTELLRVSSNVTLPLPYREVFNAADYRRIISAMAAYAQAGLEVLDATQR